MPFNDFENSLSAGRPQQLFRFMRGTEQWTYSGGDRRVLHLGRFYETLRGGIALDGGIVQGGDAGEEQFTIIAPAFLEVAQFYRGIPPSDNVAVIIYEQHYGDTDYRVSDIGMVHGVSWPSVDRCKITCLPDAASMEDQGLRLRWERACPHCIYELGCNVDRNLYKVEANILSMTATAVQASSAASYPDGYFNAGYAEWSLGNDNFDRRTIETHNSTTIVLQGGTAGLVPGRPIALYPGCDQTPPTCHNKFGNMPNYGGAHHMPGRSPFDGNPFF